MERVEISSRRFPAKLLLCKRFNQYLSVPSAQHKVYSLMASDGELSEASTEMQALLDDYSEPFRLNEKGRQGDSEESGGPKSSWASEFSENSSIEEPPAKKLRSHTESTTQSQAERAWLDQIRTDDQSRQPSTTESSVREHSSESSDVEKKDEEAT
jgi:hypothetical protein